MTELDFGTMISIMIIYLYWCSWSYFFYNLISSISVNRFLTFDTCFIISQFYFFAYQYYLLVCTSVKSMVTKSRIISITESCNIILQGCHIYLFMKSATENPSFLRYKTRYWRWNRCGVFNGNQKLKTII